ncbi:MAG: hypothetical protein ACXQTI_07835 [Candidatus Nezhaarchaeales archaeon]
MKLTVLNSRAKYDISCEPKVVSDSAIGAIVIGREAAIPIPSSYEEAVKFIENPEQLSIKEVIGILSRIRGLFIGNASRLEKANQCWTLMRLAGKVVERLDLTSSWCSCIGLTSDSIDKRVAFERIPIPELALSGNIVMGIELFNLKCRRVEFRDIPLVKFDRPKPPQSLIDIMAHMVETSVGDVVANLEGVIEDLGRTIERVIKKELDEIGELMKEGLKEGVVYVELDKLSDEIFNNICKRLGRQILELKEEAKRRLMI